MSKLYAAYGSNLNKYQMQARCPGAKVVAKSWLHDHALVFQGPMPGNAHANVIPAKGEAVPVAIWEITASDEANLDRYEGVAGGYYTKEYMTVEVAGAMREVLIYIMTPQPYGFPSGGYIRTIRKGYNDFCFDMRIFDEAVSKACENAIRHNATI